MTMTKEERVEAERIRLAGMFEDQDEIAERAQTVFGVDEAGRGPLCGPVVAGCCILDNELEILRLTES